MVHRGAGSTAARRDADRVLSEFDRFSAPSMLSSILGTTEPRAEGLPVNLRTLEIWPGCGLDPAGNRAEGLLKLPTLWSPYDLRA